MAAPDEWARTDVGPAPTVAIKYMGCGDDGNLGIRTTSLPLRTRHDDVLAQKGVKMRRYRGLAATRADEGSSGWSAHDLEERAREGLDEGAELEA